MPTKFEFEIAVAVTRVRVANRMPTAFVPDDDLAGAVLAGRYRAFKTGIGNRMVFDVHRHALVMGVEAGPFWNRPAFHRAIEFQPEVVMQPGCPVLLNHE